MVVSGCGVYFELVDGWCILDMSSLVECSNFGYQYLVVVQVICEQVEQLCFVIVVWGVELCKVLVEVLLEKFGFVGGWVFFILVGVDVNENVVKFVCLVSGLLCGCIVVCECFYYGVSYVGMVLFGDVCISDQVDVEVFGVFCVLVFYVYCCLFGSIDGDSCGCFVVFVVGEVIDYVGVDIVVVVLMELNVGINGIIVLDSYWFVLCVVICECDVLLIVDEVMSGFGCCGEWFVWQCYDEVGCFDLMMLVKGFIGVYLLLGVVVLLVEVYVCFVDWMFYIGFIYCGYLLVCVVGFVVVCVYEDEQLIECLCWFGVVMFDEFCVMQVCYLVIGDVCGGYGLFVVIELVVDCVSCVLLVFWL